MKSKNHNLPAEDDAEATLVEPRFNEEAKEAARPVVPLSQVTSANLYGRVPAGGPDVTARYGRNGWPRSVVIMLALVAVTAMVTAAALYRSARTTVPAAAAPQTVNETTVETEPQTVKSAPEPAVAERATEPVPEPSSSTTARENGTAAPAQSARESEPRSVVSVREEPGHKVRADDKRRAKDEDKVAERARKEEKKQANREEKEAERLAEQQRDAEKRGEVRPRFVGIYTERRKP